MNPYISVIIPIYNVDKYIERCVCSLMEQTLDNIEYIFINDCTPDNSMNILNLLIKRYPNREPLIKIITHNQNMGSGASRKDGILAATGEYIIHCDSDDWIDHDMYEKMYKKAIKENADIVCCNFWIERANKRNLYKYDYKYENLNHLLTLKLGCIHSSTCNKLIKLKLYRDHQILPFENINMWEDLGLTIRLRYFSRKTVIMDQAFYHYNKLNEKSIVSNPKLSSIEEQISCANNIDLFFKGEGVDDFLQSTIKAIKFQSKEMFFLTNKTRNKERWKNTFPETNKDIFKYNNLPINLRIEYWIAAHGLWNLSCFIIDLKEKIKLLLR